MKRIAWVFLIVAISISACNKKAQKETGTMFKEDLAFLKSHTNVVLLSNEQGTAQVAVCPDMQGRVMTSTADGAEGLSFGWINRKLIESGENNLHINAFGGEDRFWLGPEGGQFSIFFKKGAPFDFEHWFTPPAFNEGAYNVIAKSATRVLFRKKMHLVNYSDTNFDLELNRDVILLNKPEVENIFHVVADPTIKAVAFQSDNRITNVGEKTWTKESGLLSIWILGMFNPSPKTTIVIPFKPGPEAELGAIVNDAYFGKVPPERLVVKDSVLFFKGDGNYRSKIGISPQRVKPVLGSYDALHKTLTIVHLTTHPGVTDYVNSMWELQDKPYAGDVANSYNDGPLENGDQLGPFYEMESSSPAAALAPGETMRHVHSTVHFRGDEAALNQIAKSVLGVSLEEISGALK